MNRPCQSVYWMATACLARNDVAISLFADLANDVYSGRKTRLPHLLRRFAMTGLAENGLFQSTKRGTGSFRQKTARKM